MATATSTEHIDDLIKDADEMGCAVKRDHKSVRITPPASMPVKPFSISLNPPPSRPQLIVQLTKNGFAKARQTWEKDHAVTEPPASRPQTQETHANGLSCPECAAKGTPRTFTTPQGRAVHRYRAHGVEGTSDRSPAKKAAAKKTPKAAAKKTPAKKTAARTVPQQAASPAAETTPAPPAAPGGGLPTKTAAAVAALVHAVGGDLGDLTRLREENQVLRTFKDKVTAEASNASQAPVQTVANILALAKDSDPK